MTAIRKPVRNIVLSVAVVVLLLLAVKYIGGGFQRIATWPAFISLQEQITRELDRYHGLHGQYPDSLEALPINYAKTNHATPEMLREFTYRVTKGGYDLSWQRGIISGGISISGE